VDFNISPKMSDYTEMIKPDTGCGNINELLPPGTIIRNPTSVGINIYEAVITSSNDLINKHPDYVVFGGIETINGKPLEGTLCMFCKNQFAIHSVKKMESSEGQYSGWHYCADCKIYI
jgi:hypothetical protein